MNIKKTPILHHLLEIEALDRKTITHLLDKADFFLKTALAKNTLLDNLNGQVMVNLFFEPSTRTLNSFEIAGKRLGAMVLSPDLNRSSTIKGESLLDTIHTLEAMGTKIFVVRHPDNHTVQFITSELTTSAHVINAGDGTHQHPTQALLDLLTIRQLKTNFENLKVAIIGDISHSRVAKSLVLGLSIMGTKDIRLICPTAFIPNDISKWPAKLVKSMQEGLSEADVIMTLRIQKERLDKTSIPNEKEYYENYGLTHEKLIDAKQDVIVMHPGPLNRGVEIESKVADGQHSVILKQVQNGVAVRMALLDSF